MHRVYILVIGILRVVTAGENIVLGGSFTFSQKISETAEQFYVVMPATRDTQSPMFKGEKQTSTSLSHNGTRTRVANMTGECSLYKLLYCAYIIILMHLQCIDTSSDDPRTKRDRKRINFNMESPFCSA